MNAPALAPRFVQVAWVVRDIQAAEAFFKKVMGVPKFLQIHNLKASDTNGTYMGQPADWVIHLSIAYAGETQIELIQPVSGASVYQEWLDKHGEDGVQHVAYWLDDSEYDAAAAHLTAAGFPLVQGFSMPMARIGYFDTRPAIGVVTELIGATAAGKMFIENLKAGNL
jgi:catechol 2,3-dioxygenase-like lactoylglutathione lyase family enzyme